MLRGLPASGKTTWAKEQIKIDGNIKRVNKDDLRAMLDNGLYSKTNEAFILLTRDNIVRNALCRGASIIVDDTNIVAKHEEALRQLAQMNGADFEIKDFDVPVDECIERDSKRGDKSVGKRVIREMAEQYKPQKPASGLNQNSDLPGVVICDLDGTVALLNGRDPYNASTCENDLPNEPVLTALKRLTLPVYFVSGRDGSYAPQTMNWLNKHFGTNYSLSMRDPGDSRKDSIVKEEILRNDILPNHKVLFVFDDRDQVVKMWRSLGLTCFQVAEGNF